MITVGLALVATDKGSNRNWAATMENENENKKGEIHE
jgi:hypothetical protein